MGMEQPRRRRKLTIMEHVDGIHRSVFRRLRSYFLGGVLVTAPIGITVYLTWLFLRFIDAKVTAIIPAQLNPFLYWPYGLPGLDLFKALTSLVVVIAFFVLVGWFVRNFFGRLLYRISEYIVHRMPVISQLYGTIKQIFETVMTDQSKAFREVVMFQYPREGIWTMGFVTGPALNAVTDKLNDGEVVNVFLPTTPSPTNGILLFIPRSELVVMDISVEDAFKMVLSSGILTADKPKADIIVKA